MLRNTFANGAEVDGSTVKIMSVGEKYLSHMQKYPVISLSLKSAKQPDWELS